MEALDAARHEEVRKALADVSDEPVKELSTDEAEVVVRRVLGEQALKAPPQSRGQRLRRTAARFLRPAMLVPIVLVGLGATVTIRVLFFFEDLSYRDAVNYSQDQTLDHEKRITACGKVHRCIVTGIESLRDLREVQGELPQPVRDVLARLITRLQELEQPGPEFPPTGPRPELDDLVKILQPRQRALATLERELTVGVHALNRVQLREADNSVGRNVAAWTKDLRRRILEILERN